MNTFISETIQARAMQESILTRGNTTAGYDFARPFVCAHCEKAYNKEGTLRNHLLKEHNDRLREIGARLVEEDNEKKSRFASEAIARFFGDAEKRFATEMAEFQEKFAKDPVHTMSWRAEGLTKLTVTRNEVAKIHELWKSTPLPEFIEMLEAHRVETCESLLQSPFRSSSTSRMSNAIEEWSYQAMCEFWGGRFYGDSAKSLIKYARIALGNE